MMKDCGDSAQKRGEASENRDSSLIPHPSSFSDLKELAGQLDKLETLLTNAKEQIASHLTRRESPPIAAETDDTALAALWEKVDALGAKIDKVADAVARAPAAKESPAPAAIPAASIQPLVEKMEGLGREQAALRQTVQKLQEQLDRGFEHMAELLSPPAPQGQEEPPVSSTQWERAILGPALADHALLAFQRQQLLSGVLDKEPGACALAGELLIFQSSPAERLPQLLKDLGEAYYRWQPKTQPGANPMEESLAAWLQKTCEAAGIYNAIELVHPGERFDAARHNASSRGVEITEVLGWVVLRDNGKVYTKANVAVR